MSADDGRSKKRRQYEVAGDEKQTLSGLLNEEIDHEIALRVRLKETVESRLTWALILHDTLENHYNSSPRAGENAQSQFREVAIDAYHATDAPSRFLLDEDEFETLPISDSLPSAISVADQPFSQTQGLTPSRHSHRHHSSYHTDDRKEPNKYLFIRDTQATPTMVYKIACPDCGRSNFLRLQALLNHCRLKHKLEFGSHDECIQHCASIVPDDEQPWIIDQGLEITGMSASLKRLFEMAVGADSGILAPSAAGDAYDTEYSANVHSPDEKIQSQEATLVSKTLGHHKNTPALAPFLGRAPKKRQINAYDGDELIDIMAVDDDTNPSVPRIDWTMTYRQRSQVGRDDDEGLLGADEDEDDGSPAASHIPRESHLTQHGSTPPLHGGSRFHITARLAVSDWSLRLSDGEVKKYQSQGSATHKWMVSVQSPSYSVHASTVLMKVTVSSATEPPPPAFSYPLSVTDPPFCVTGVTDRPFLARITLQWSGARNKPTQIEHWVELDCNRSARPVVGDEQIIDVELDRNTDLMPRRDDTWIVDWYSDNDKKRTASKADPNDKSGAVREPEHVKRLKALLPRYPMTAKDAGVRVLPRVPYFLPPTVKQFNGMVVGRQKAIELGRARAVWDEYSVTEYKEAQLNPGSNPHERFFSPTDVYRWMKAEGYFPQSSLQQSSSAGAAKSDGADGAEKTFCAFCGLRASLHSAKGQKVKGTKTKQEDEPPVLRVCPLPEWATRGPILDVHAVRSQHQGESPGRRPRPRSKFSVSLDPGAFRALLRVVDPAMTLAVRRIVSALQLSCLSPASSSLPEDGNGGVENDLAPFALLAATARIFIRRVTTEGLRAMESKPEAKAGAAHGHTRRGWTHSSGSRGSGTRLLAPSHIFRGLVDGSRRRDAGQSAQGALLLLSMARLGVEVQSSPGMTATAQASTPTATAPGESSST